MYVCTSVQCMYVCVHPHVFALVLQTLVHKQSHYYCTVISQVTGEILLECDEDILENDLHVSSRIHRIRVTKIISGKVSAEDTLHKRPYTAHTTH